MKAEMRKLYRVKQEAEERNEFDAKWTVLNQRLAESDTKFEAPKIPFRKEDLIRDFNPLYYKIYDKVKAVEM